MVKKKLATSYNHKYYYAVYVIHLFSQIKILQDMF